VNPTTLLISAIEKSALTCRAAKDDEFYLGVLRDDEVWEIHHIMSGSPSRGTMALETETAPGGRARPFRYGTCFTMAVCGKNIEILFE
jgi:hypothetical protein